MSVFLLWTAFALPWFAATALWGRASRFTSGVLVAGCIIALSLHAISPERVIVASHLDGTRDPATIDFEYLKTLGVGAVVPLVERFDQIPPDEQILFEEQWEEEFGRERRSVAATVARWQGERAFESLRRR